MKNLVGKKVQIVSDNENYTEYVGKTLRITHASNSGPYYDKGMYPEMLCDLETLDGQQVGFALYEYEFQVL